MSEHKDYKKQSTNKLAKITQKVEVDMKQQFKDVNFASEDLNQRLFQVQ